MAQQTFRINEQHTLFNTPKEVKTPYLLCLLLVSATALIALVMYTTFPEIIPLFYSLSAPEQHLVQNEWLLFIPALGAIIFFFNVGLVQLLKFSDMTFVKIIAWVTTGLLGTLLFSIIRIWIILS